MTKVVFGTGGRGHGELPREVPRLAGRLLKNFGRGVTLIGAVVLSANGVKLVDGELLQYLDDPTNSDFVSKQQLVSTTPNTGD